MASQYLPTLVTTVTGTASSATLISASAGQSTRIWQMLIAGTTTDTVTIVFTYAGVATTVRLVVTNNTLVLPMSGAPWAVADTGTAITFTAAATTTITAYYTKAIGG